MAVIETTPVVGENYRTFTATSDTIIGVRLAKTIPQGDWTIASPSAGDEEGGVRVRPTNVTATISTAASADPDFIVLHNGPKGGFTQQLKFETGGANFRTNAVVTAVITNG